MAGFSRLVVAEADGKLVAMGGKLFQRGKRSEMDLNL
jgi:hypothetical protein